MPWGERIQLMVIGSEVGEEPGASRMLGCKWSVLQLATGGWLSGPSMMVYAYVCG